MARTISAFVRQVEAEIALPWFAIGGINALNLAEVKSAGARRIAVSGTILTATDPYQTTSELLAGLLHAAAEVV
jgi:thiamine-phosphate pyrophosphorylase